MQHVINDARNEGYISVVGFPVVRDERYEWDCPGPIWLYEKFGFIKVSEKDGRVVVRKELK